MDTSVWIIDDIDTYRETIKELIDDEIGLSLTGSFPSCEKAITALEHGNETMPDVVLMDIGLGKGNMNGVEGTHRIKSLHPSVQIVMLTIQSDAEVVFDALHAGASGYLLKEDMNEILEGAHDARQGGVPMTAVIARKVLAAFREKEGSETDYKLTRREKEILECLVNGHQQKEIAEILHISPYTVDSHVRNIYAKLHVNSRSMVVAKALQEGIVKTKKKGSPIF